MSRLVQFLFNRPGAVQLRALRLPLDTERDMIDLAPRGFDWFQ
jgi:hypothetical protein